MRFYTLASLAPLVLETALGAVAGLDPRKPAASSDAVSVSQYCSKDDFYTPSSSGQRYTFDTNQWAWSPGQPGYLCMKVSKFANDTYATEKSAPPFSITWQYPQGPEGQPVHAYPHVALNAEKKYLPASLGSLKRVHVNVEWSYGLGSDAVGEASTNVNDLASSGVNTNVAIDMFADYDMTTALDASTAHYEIMVWFAMVGTAAPIGYPNVLMTRRVNGTTFNLYGGQNFAGQEVLTWLAKKQTTHFNGDLAPLLQNLGSAGPDPSAYLGSMSFGTEAFDTPQPVTFNVPRLVMNPHV